MQQQNKSHKYIFIYDELEGIATLSIPHYILQFLRRWTIFSNYYLEAEPPCFLRSVGKGKNRQFARETNRMS